MLYRRTLLAGLLVAALAGCGHSSQSAKTSGVMTSAPENPAASSVANPPLGGTDQSGNAMAVGTLATVPPTLQCGAVLPVWVNLRSHVYHTQRDPRYGRTKHGEYMCPSTAKARGFRAARGASEAQP